jgi:septum formation protein
LEKGAGGLIVLKKIVLASMSPRRQELLKHITNDFIIYPSSFDESEVPSELCPVEHVKYSSKMKALDVAEKYPDDIIIGADTVVSIDEHILGKPADTKHAKQMLNLLSGRTHQVYTGYAIIDGDKLITGYAKTDVKFRELNNDIIEKYISTKEPMDKAGAYAIQGLGCILVESICGCYFNVVGFPVQRISVELEGLGISG